jgi:coenzyme F420 biosynthesis associated uncharacterized protein
MGSMIDWSLAGTVARGVSALAPAAAERVPFPDMLPAAEESERLISAYTGLVAAAPVPVAEAVGRDGWIDANLRSLQGVLDPAVERVGAKLGPLAGPMTAIAGGALAIEAGAISGFLASRVLGQYEFPVLDPAAPARLLFVAPNLAHATETMEVDADQLLRWVALHETTHALQFGAVPWLREYLAGMVRELLGSLEVMDPGRLLKLPDLSDLRGLVDQVRDNGLAGMGISPERRELLERAQAFMAMLEGYAEHVMDAVGIDLLPDLPVLRHALEQRRRERSGFMRVLEKLIGMDLKLRQYEQGKAFCDSVVSLGGIAALNRAWSAPEALPTLAELDDALAWLARTERLGLGPRAA